MWYNERKEAIMKRANKYHTPETREAAAREWLYTNKTLKEVANEYGAGTSSIHNWAKLYEAKMTPVSQG